jgi:hypothetical protein
VESREAVDPPRGVNLSIAHRTGVQDREDTDRMCVANRTRKIIPPSSSHFPPWSFPQSCLGLVRGSLGCPRLPPFPFSPIN